MCWFGNNMEKLFLLMNKKTTMKFVKFTVQKKPNQKFPPPPPKIKDNGTNTRDMMPQVVSALEAPATIIHKWISKKPRRSSILKQMCPFRRSGA